MSGRLRREGERPGRNAHIESDSGRYVSRRRVLLLVSGSAVMLVSCTGGSVATSPAAMAGLHGAVLPPTLQPATVTLTDVSGKAFSFPGDATHGLTLLYFGYTNCEDECPTTMATLASARHRLDAELRDRAQVLFVTTDPERDTPDVLHVWLAQFDVGFVGLRGTEEQVARLMSSVALAEPAHAAASGDDYRVVHATNVLVYPGSGKSWLLYDADTSSADWAADLTRLGGAL